MTRVRYEMPWWTPIALIGMAVFLAAACACCWLWNTAIDAKEFLHEKFKHRMD